MPQVSFQAASIDRTSLSTICQELLICAGVLPDDASIVADTLVEANLRGVDSHGVARLPHYLRRLSRGSINGRPQMRLETLGPAAARLDGDHGLGQLVMLRATDEATRMAQSAGAGWVAVANSSHCGALAYYGLRMANAGMIGLVFTHVDPMVLPFGSRLPFCGTNPLCIAVPRALSGAENLRSGALCLDMATSKTPWNTVMNAAQEGVRIPHGWAVDAGGVDTTDANQVAALYPFGGYKGSGLGLMIDVLCAMLSDAPYGPDIPRMYGDLTERRRLGGLVGAIDIARFVPLERFCARINELIVRWGALPPAVEGDRVLFPGELELRERHRRLQEGIPLGLELLKEINRLAQAAGIRPLAHEGIATHPPSQPAGPHLHIAANQAVSRDSMTEDAE